MIDRTLGALFLLVCMFVWVYIICREWRREEV